jgi:hypothetical protein
MIRSPAPTPEPFTPVIVKVVMIHTSSGTDWIPLAVAIGGVLLSLASLGWQAFTYWRSGHRVQVELRGGAVDPKGTLVSFSTGPKNIYPIRSLAPLIEQGFRTPALTATIRNVGRQSVTIQQVSWKAGDMTLAQPRTIVGDSFPKRLEAGDQCLAVIDLPIITAILAASNAVLKGKRRDGTAVADLGTGKSVRSKSLVIPPELDPPTPVPASTP